MIVKFYYYYYYKFILAFSLSDGGHLASPDLNKQFTQGL